jgi:hypothetical protein
LHLKQNLILISRIARLKHITFVSLNEAQQRGK